MKRAVIISAILITALLAAACGGGTTVSTTSTTPAATSMAGTAVAVDGGGTYWKQTAAQFAAFISDQSVFLVDADTEYVGEIAGTDLFINSDTVAANLAKFPADKTAKIAVYCTSGMKSQTVAIILVQAGYTRVAELEGGIISWKMQGYPTLSNGRTMT